MFEAALVFLPVIVVLALLIALLYMGASLDIFSWRKLSDALRSRRPVELRDPATWRDSKRLARLWVSALVVYIGMGVVLGELLPDAHPAWIAVYAVAPLVLLAWWGLKR